MLFLQRIKWLVILLLFQVLVLNHVHIYQYATPLFYVYFILKLNSQIERKALLGWAFAIGLCVDIFSNTPGLNAAAATLLAFVRPFLLFAQTQRDPTENFEPGIAVMGFASFFRYALVCTLLFALVLNTLDTFSFFNIKTLLIKAGTDTLVTLICILCVDAVRRKK
jgi:rod shape-determining protein MreD